MNEKITLEEASLIAMARVYGPPELLPPAGGGSTPIWKRYWFVITLCLIAIVVIRTLGEGVEGYDFQNGLPAWLQMTKSHIGRIGIGVGLGLGVILLSLRKGTTLNVAGHSWGVSILLAILSVIGGTTYTRYAVTQYASMEIIEREEFFMLTNWVLLDAPSHWPGSPDVVDETGHSGHSPTKEQLRFELAALKQAGFTGICIYGDPQIEFLEMAKTEFEFAIIQGIPVPDSEELEQQDLSDPGTQRQIRQAIAGSDFIDAIVLRNLHAEKVKMTQLQDELAKIRQRTGKPVTPCFLLSEYLNKHGFTESGRNLLKLSDFMVTDLDRPYSHDPPGGDPVQAAAKVADAVDELKDAGQPVVLSFVGFPSAAGEGFSEESQQKFIEQVMEIERPRGLGIAFSGAFDLPWKQILGEGKPWECDGHIGFFRTELSEDGSKATFTAKPSLEAFQKSLQ